MTNALYSGRNPRVSIAYDPLFGCGKYKVNLLVETTWSHHLVPKTLIPVSSQWTEWDANNCFITASSKCSRLLKHSFSAFLMVAGLIHISYTHLTLPTNREV